MRVFSLICGTAFLLVGLALTWQPSAAGSLAATRVIDRTLLCTPGVRAGVRIIHVKAQSAFRKGPTLEWLAQATVTIPVGTRQARYDTALAGVTAGWPPPPPLTSGGMGFEGKLCRSTRASVAFSSHGLGGGAASQLGEELQCYPPREVLVRVRAAFRTPTTITFDKKRSFYDAIGRIEKAQIAVRTLTGKPLVHAEILESGKARLFTARSCI
jgi:hypothetical protein